MSIKRFFSVISILLLGSFFHVLSNPDAKAQSILPSFGKERTGLSGYQFTKIDVDPRSAAMGSSIAADISGASSLYWNPAMASITGKSGIMASNTSYFVDIPMNYLAGIWSIKNLTFGLSFQSVSSGEMDVTTEFYPQGTGQTFSTFHYSLGATVSQKLTDAFHYGATIRYYEEDLFGIEYRTVGIDFGFFFDVPSIPIRFAVAINNFGLDANPEGTVERLALQDDGQPIIEEDLENILLPTRFVLAMAADVYTSESIDILATTQITNYSDHAERFGFGLELKAFEQFMLRTGYTFGQDDIKGPSMGGGVELGVGEQRFNFDYSYNRFTLLGEIHRLAFQIAL